VWPTRAQPIYHTRIVFLFRQAHFMERTARIELASSAWKAEAQATRPRPLENLCRSHSLPPLRGWERRRPARIRRKSVPQFFVTAAAAPDFGCGGLESNQRGMDYET